MITTLKTDRNSPCACGSGKIYELCCLGKQGTAQDFANDIAEAATEQPFTSLEELDSYATQRINERNQRALDEFCGLSPGQMYHLLYSPFSSPETIHFSIDAEGTLDAGIMRLFIPMVEAIGTSGLKATATGNLPQKFCNAMAEQLRQEDSVIRLLPRGNVRSETDLEELHCTRLVAQLAGLIRKYRGKFVLTRKCRELFDMQDIGSLYFELFKTYTTKFNWGYRDAYPEAEIVQQSFLYTLYLLTSFGDVQRSQRFYEDKFLAAFPMAADMFAETSYSTAEDSARHCYFIRSLVRFASFFGLAQLNLKSRKSYQERYLIQKNSLLDQLVTFW